MRWNDDLGEDTLLAHFAEEKQYSRAVVAPIFQNSLFTFETVDEMFAVLGHYPDGDVYHYSRINNPTLEIAERKIAKLEHTDRAKLVSSGMAAISGAILSCVKAGSHVVCVDTVYGDTLHFFRHYLARFGITYSVVDGRDTQAIIDACRPETDVIYLESPTSLLFRLQDLPEITAFAREKGISTIIDNTYCTPLLMTPATMGVDIVVHSATKYFGGHSDLVAGVICCNQSRMEAMLVGEIKCLGAAAAPLVAWLITRGLRTLKLRLKQHEETANLVASWLENQPEIDIVHHLGLPSFAQREVFEKTMKGSSGLFSFEPKNQNSAAVKKFVERLNLFHIGVSWGGFESLVVAFQLQPLDYPEKRWVVRLFCGLEDADDLMADIAQALPALR